jgi:hypothetical protein
MTNTKVIYKFHVKKLAKRIGRETQRLSVSPVSRNEQRELQGEKHKGCNSHVKG